MITFRLGWTRMFDEQGAYYQHVSGWRVRDNIGPNNGFAIAVAGPENGLTLTPPHALYWFSVTEAMQGVEKHLRTV